MNKTTTQKMANAAVALTKALKGASEACEAVTSAYNRVKNHGKGRNHNPMKYRLLTK